MDFDRKETKKRVCYAIAPSIVSKIRKIAKKENLPMGVVVAQLIEKVWKEGGYDAKH